MARAKHKTIKISAPTNTSGTILGMAAAQLEALYPESFPRGLPKLTKRTVTIPTDMLDMMSSELERQTDESFAYELSEELGVDYDEAMEAARDAEDALAAAGRQRNPLRARPPQSFHGLDMGGSQRFRRSVGRTMTADDAAGVHTTGNFNIAAMYGAPTAKKTDSFVVVLELDTSGLEPLPDVDAMMEAADTLGDSALRMDAEGMDLEEFNESCYEYGSESYISPGEDLWVAIFGEQVRGGMCQAFDSQADFERWVRTGEYTDAEAARVVDQQRYLHDFDFDRLIRVHVVQPWWPKIEWEDPDGDREEERFDTIQEAGYQIYTVEDALNGAQLASKTVAKGGSTAKRGEYHGTSAALALQAFPELGEISNPYEVMDLDQLERILDRLEENPAPRSRRRKARKLGPTMRKLLRGL